jgi:hypothetical protein
VIPAILAIVAQIPVIVILLQENRRLTNLLLSKNPSITIATENTKRSKTKPKEKESQNERHAWHNPTEAVGP